ncbi:MAG: monovalent cation/H(+) antiporter subunit G [Thermomicrobiales bacterium]
MNWALAREIVADAFIVLGLVVMTIGVIGIVRMPDVYTKLHAASKSVFLGVCSFLVAVSFSGDPGIIARAVLIGVLLVFTTPVAAHEIARAAAREQLLKIENQQQPPVK